MAHHRVGEQREETNPSIGPRIAAQIRHDNAAAGNARHFPQDDNDATPGQEPEVSERVENMDANDYGAADGAGETSKPN